MNAKRALVTGAARGIGLAVADALADTGTIVVRADIRPLADEDHQVDVNDAGAVRALVEGCGPFDIVINNAGTVRRTSPTDPWEQAASDFDAVAGTNLRGALLVGRAAVAGMIERGGGDIVNVRTDHVHTCGWPSPVDHSDAGDCPYAAAPRPPGGGPSMDVYDAGKWGLAGLTLSWAGALESQGIRVNGLCVGATETAMLRSFLNSEPDPALVASWLTPAEVASVVLDLLAEGPGGRTGDLIGVWPGHPVLLPRPGRFAGCSTASPSVQ